MIVEKQVQPTPVAYKHLDIVQTLKISDAGAIKKVDPYVSTKKLDYIEINPVSTKSYSKYFIES